MSISGTATGGTIVTVAVYGLVSKDLPTILLSRTKFVANADGRYGGALAFAPNYFSGSTIRVVASGADAQTVVATVRVGPPNKNETSLPDSLPKP